MSDSGTDSEQPKENETGTQDDGLGAPAGAAPDTATGDDVPVDLAPGEPLAEAEKPDHELPPTGSDPDEAIHELDPVEPPPDSVKDNSGEDSGEKLPETPEPPGGVGGGGGAAGGSGSGGTGGSGGGAGDEGTTEVNWDVIGLSTAAISLVGAGIFYVVGWAYESSWYGFFGINMAQISLSPAQVIVQGVPGVLLTFGVVAGLVGVVAVVRTWQTDSSVQLTDLPLVLTLSYAIMATVALLFAFPTMRSSFPHLTLDDRSIQCIIVLATLLIAIALSLSRYRHLTDRLPTLQDFIRRIDRVLAVTWRYWLGIALLLLLFLSILVSRFLGEFDARRRSRIFEGDWKIPLVNVYSSEELGALRDHELKSGESDYEYGPFSLVVSNESTLFLITWDHEASGKAAQRPSLYLIPRESHTDVTLFSPTTTPTPTATATTEPERPD